MYHITQPTEAHTPQAVADPGPGPNIAGQESTLCTFRFIFGDGWTEP